MVEKMDNRMAAMMVERKAGRKEFSMGKRMADKRDKMKD